MQEPEAKPGRCIRLRRKRTNRKARCARHTPRADGTGGRRHMRGGQCCRTRIGEQAVRPDGVHTAPSLVHDLGEAYGGNIPAVTQTDAVRKAASEPDAIRQRPTCAGREQRAANGSQHCGRNTNIARRRKPGGPRYWIGRDDYPARSGSRARKFRLRKSASAGARCFGQQPCRRRCGVRLHQDPKAYL